MRSPIFRSIAIGVFLSILLIETILLIHSWISERERLLSQLEGSLIALTSLLDHANPKPQLDSLLAADQTGAKLRVIGYVIEIGDNAISSAGNSKDLMTLVDASQSTMFSAETGIFNMLLNPAADSSSRTTIRLRTDASWINQYMVSYVWRIFFMIVVISLFVTAGSLVFLTPLLITPLQRLNHLLIKGRKKGIRNVDINSKDLQRSDELGSVFCSFNILRNDLVRSEDLRMGILQRSEEFASISADCFWELDHRLKLTYLSGDVQRLLSIQPEDFIGLPVNDLLSEFSSRIPKASTIADSLKLTGKWEGVIQRGGNEDEAMFIKIIATVSRSPTGRISYLRGTIVDIDEETKLANKLKYQAVHDELTGLCNRRELSNRLAQGVEKFQTNGTVFTLAVLDLDRFKVINDTCGHVAGDMLLQALAALITDTVEEGDLVARTGGDEFAVILNDKNIERAANIAKEISSKIEQYRFSWNNEVFSFTASIGLAEITTELLSEEAIVFAADSCCFEAKKAGKNQIHTYSSSNPFLYRYKDEAHWIAKIRNALVNDHFLLFRQFIVRIGVESDLDHFEVLLRMGDGNGGFYPPGDFLPVAERNGMMPEIDRWVVTEAGKWLGSQELNGAIGYCVSINLSPNSLANKSFRQFLLEWVSSHQGYAQSMCFEVTESAAMINLDATVELLTSLRQLGCRIALDDFGTGFSSLSHIRELPLDYIKIDGSFVRDINNNLLDQAVVKSVVDFARVLEIRTIAEFVETKEVLSVLNDLQIDFAQGYLFSKPEPLNRVEIANPLIKAA